MRQLLRRRTSARSRALERLSSFLRQHGSHFAGRSRHVRRDLSVECRTAATPECAGRPPFNSISGRRFGNATSEHLKRRWSSQQSSACASSYLGTVTATANHVPLRKVTRLNVSAVYTFTSCIYRITRTRWGATNYQVVSLRHALPSWVTASRLRDAGWEMSKGIHSEKLHWLY